MATLGKSRKYDNSSPRDPKQPLAQRGLIGEWGSFNKIQTFLLFFTRIELGASKQAKNTLLKSTKTFHYRQAHSENFHFFVNF